MTAAKTVITPWDPWSRPSVTRAPSADAATDPDLKAALATWWRLRGEVDKASRAAGAADDVARAAPGVDQRAQAQALFHGESAPAETAHAAKQAAQDALVHLRAVTDALRLASEQVITTAQAATGEAQAHRAQADRLAAEREELQRQADALTAEWRVHQTWVSWLRDPSKPWTGG
jgi:hypothetical protein